jgi:hypothetical protein
LALVGGHQKDRDSLIVLSALLVSMLFIVILQQPSFPYAFDNNKLMQNS